MDMKKLINKHADLINFRWKVEECDTKDCWCAIITTEEPVFWEQSPEEEAYISPSGSIPKEVAEHIVELHNEELKYEN